MLSYGGKEWSVCAGEQAVVSDFHKSFWEDMLQEASDELFRWYGLSFEPPGMGIFILEGHLTVFEFEDMVVAERDAEDIGSEVLEGLLSGSYGLGVDDPVLLSYGFQQVNTFELSANTAKEAAAKQS